MFESNPSASSVYSSEADSGVEASAGVFVPFGGSATRTQLPEGELVRLAPADRIALLRRSVAGPIVFTHGFGVEGQLLLHWIVERNVDIDVVALDTGRLFPETYELWERTERRYGRRVRAIYPHHLELERMVAKQGINGFYESKQARMTCCDVRKTRPLDLALKGASAWIAGRSGQSGACPVSAATYRRKYPG